MNRLKIAAAALVLTGAALAQTQKLRTFDSAQDAAQTLIHAAASDDAATLTALFGPGGKRILASGDDETDKKERAEFAKLAGSKHRLEADPMNPNRMILDVGSEDWPFPVPIVKKNAKWSFDPAEGQMEMRARRVGANELNTIEICAGYVEAQQQYAAAHGGDGMHAYAQRVMSSPGKQDGLFSQVSGGAQPLVPQRFAEAAADSGTAQLKPYHGYYFKILKAQGPNAAEGSHNYIVKDTMIGGFGLVGWPAEYGVTGVHTFLVNFKGEIFEKDLGPATGAKAKLITRFDPDRSWTLVE
jgi:hypothetical protein